MIKKQVVDSLTNTSDVEEGTKLMRHFFYLIEKKLVVGVCGLELDNYMSKLFETFGCISAPIREYNFPGSICISINDCMCHGIPSDYKFCHGDLISIDISFFYKEYFYDAGRSFVILDPYERISHHTAAIIELNSFNIAINHLTIELLSKQFMVAGDNKLDYATIGRIYMKFLSSMGGKYITSAEYGGHRIGDKLHLTPFISSIDDKNTNVNICVGHRFCFEPLLTLAYGREKYIIARKEGWHVYNSQHNYVTHYENTYLVTANGIVSIT